jgi:hypothetical protein
MFVESPVSNPAFTPNGFLLYARVNIGFKKPTLKCVPWVVEETQDGINCHVGIIDEYHAHKDDTVKENLEHQPCSAT